jgi:heme A synthase
MMKPFVIGAALALFAIAAPALVHQAQAAPARNPFCAMAGGQKNPMGWDEYYGCFGSAPGRAAVVHHVHERHATKDPLCSLANQEKNPMGWDEYYHCW